MSTLDETLRTRWFSLSLHAVLWLVLLFTITSGVLSGNTPRLQETQTNPTAVTALVPTTQLQILFAATNYIEQLVDPSLPNPFTTRHFIPPTPPPSQPPPAAPPPPTTWKIELTYQGFYRMGDGPKYAVVRVGEKLVSVPVGAMVVTNLSVLDATIHTLTLTTTATQTNVIALNVKQIVEVPLK